MQIRKYTERVLPEFSFYPPHPRRVWHTERYNNFVRVEAVAQIQTGSIIKEEETMENNMRTANAESTVNVSVNRRVNKWIYILLALCLGGLGLHNFYAGNTVIGVIWLVLFGLGFLLSFIGIGWLLIFMLWVVAIVQAVIMLCRSADADGNIAV